MKVRNLNFFVTLFWGSKSLNNFGIKRFSNFSLPSEKFFIVFSGTDSPGAFRNVSNGEVKRIRCTCSSSPCKAGFESVHWIFHPWIFFSEWILPDSLLLFDDTSLFSDLMVALRQYFDFSGFKLDYIDSATLMQLEWNLEKDSFTKVDLKQFSHLPTFLHLIFSSESSLLISN